MMAGLRDRFSLKERQGPILKALLIIVLLVWPLVYSNDYGMRVMTTAGLYAIITIAVVVILGQAGQLSFGYTSPWAAPAMA